MPFGNYSDLKGFNRRWAWRAEKILTEKSDGHLTCMFNWEIEWFCGLWVIMKIRLRNMTWLPTESLADSLWRNSCSHGQIFRLSSNTNAHAGIHG
jgi:hypothetical protein